MDTIIEGALKEKKLEFVRNVSVQHENIIGDPLKTTVADNGIGKIPGGETGAAGRG